MAMESRKYQVARSLRRVDEALAIQRERLQEALKIFIPTEVQQPILDCKARELAISGGNRCLGKDELIYDPVENAHRKVSEIDGSFHVLSYHPKGEIVARRASKPFMKTANGELYKFTLGQSFHTFVATKEHRVLSSKGKWISLEEACSGLGELIRPAAGLGLGQEHVAFCEPAGTGEVWDFSVDETENYLHKGIFHHNSSKTTISAFLWACLLLGKIRHPNIPLAPDVNDHEACKRFDGRLYIVGKDQTHLGEVLYRKLFRIGAFKVIKDEETGLMRAYLPWKDADRAKETKPGPPFIPKRYIESESYRLKKDNVPRMVRLKNGWEIMFFTGEGVPAQGFDVNGIWFDEEIENREWYQEAKRGLVDRGGMLVWSATPQAATDQFLNILDRADSPEATCAKFILPSYSNPHLSKEEIDAFSEGMTEDERKVRIQGEPATASFLMYPTFDMSYIGMSWDRLPKKEIPEDWTRYAAIDPGYGVTAVVFFAVPPPSSSYGDIVVAYDELYITKCTSEKFAEAMALKMGKFEFQAFLIDDKQAAKTETTGKTIKQQLAEALRERNVSSVCGGFIPGEVDNEAGCHAVRDALRPRSGLGPKYRIMEAACPNLERNFQKLRRKRIRGASGDWVYKDVPADNQDDHAFDCFRYMVCFDPRWVEPTPRTPPKPWALLRYELKQKKNGGNKRCVTLGPPQKRR